MKKKKVADIPKKSKKRVFTHRIVSLVLIIASAILLINASNSLTPQEQIFKGKLNSINASANMLDSLNTTNNVVISPLNTNISLGILYNATDNNTKKEIKAYFKEEPNEINSTLKEKLTKINNIADPKPANHELYEEFLNEILNNSYLDYTLNNIEKLSQSDKEKLTLIAIQTNLAYDRITNNQDEKIIRDYKLNDKERAYNEYQIKELLDKVADSYSTYRLTNGISNYNTIFYNQNLKITESYKKTIKDYYGASLIPLDYANLIDSKTTINNSLHEFSNEINRVLSDNELENNNIIMINSLNFNYKWEEPFDYKSNDDSEFIGFEDKHYLVEMMYSKEKIYLENAFATGFIKNFADGKYSFIAVLPKEEGDFNLSKLDIESLLKSPKNIDVLVGLPKFSYTSTTDLSKIYSYLKINEISTNKANISKMTDSKEYIYKNIQKININIGDKGTLDSNLISLSIDSFNTDEIARKVILNRPFAYLIIDNETQETILIGKYTTPNN